MAKKRTKPYTIELYKSRKSWLKNRGIGGSELNAIVNFNGKWGNITDVYNRLVNGESDTSDNASMARGRKAEEPIKELFLIQHPELKRQSPTKEIMLVRRADYPEITLSPDTLVYDREKREYGFIEIKYKQIFNENAIDTYLEDLKTQEPQYYWQLIQYFIAKKDTSFGYLTVCFDLMSKKEDEWVRDKLIIDSLYVEREILKEDIEVGEKAEIQFITENVRTKTPPRAVIDEQQQRKEKEIWNKLLNTTK